MIKQANPLQVWQCSFKARSLVSSPTQSDGSESYVRDSSEKYSSARKSDWLSVFLDHPFLVHHLSFTEIKNSDLSMRQTFNLATLVPDAVVNLKNIWQKEPETFIGVLLCADVSGFTNLCEQSTASGRGTYHITEALNYVFGAMVELIYRSDGDVLKFSGDALLAVWRVRKDQYLFDILHQVISCGLLIQNTLLGYRTESNMALKVKIAISAGMLHFSVIGSERARHYVVVGKPVQEVKEAGSRCASGDVLVAASAWDHCCPRNYDYTTKDGSYIKVSRILYNPSGQRVYMTKMLYALSQGGENRHSATRRPPRINDATPSSYSSESLSQRSSLPIGSASDSSLESSSSSSSSVESFASKDSIEIPISPTSSFSEAGTNRLNQSSLGISMRSSMDDVRPSVGAAARQTAGAHFRPFMIPPVAQQVDADQPLEYLTEMRHVTTMFVNVVPLEVINIALISLVDHVYSTVCRIVYSSLGVVNKVSLFDKDVMLLCVFGLRGFKHQQESQSALRCGATVKRALSRVRGVRYVSIGITTGTAYCGVVGHPLRREYTVVGSLVNHAARLMVAYPGKVSCEQNTRRLSCLPAQLFRALPQRTMKGIKHITEVYEYHEDTRKCGPVLMSATGPLLGRGEIIAEVGHQLEPRHRKYQVIMAMGEPRIGKSRLLTVLAKSFGRETTSVLLQLQPVHSAMPFAAAHFIARQILGLNIAERQARLRQLLPDVSREDLSTLNKKLAVNFPRFAESKTADESVSSKSRTGRRETAIMLIVRLVQSLASQTVFLLDDAHHADDVSCQIAADVVRVWRSDPDLRSALGPLVIATVTVSPLRPPPAINRAMANLACVRYITLGPLPSDLLPALACQLLNVRAVEFQLIRVLEENSRGNPGWCESYLSALLSSHGLRVEMMALSEMRSRTFCVPDTALLTFCQCKQRLSTATVASLARSRSGTESQRRSEDDSVFGDSSRESFEDDQEDSEGSEEMPEDQGSDSRSRETRGETFKYFRSLFQSWRALWKGAASTVDLGPDSVEYCLRTRSGRCSACSMEDESKVMPVCLLAPHLDYNQEVAAHLNGAIVASFDSLPPMEQLLLKCGSVLGDVFHRSVLLQLLKGLRPVSKKRVILAVQRLFEMCVLECSIPGPKALSSELSCRCEVEEKGTALNEEETQVLFSGKDSYPEEFRPSEQSNETKDGVDAIQSSASGNSMAPKHASLSTERSSTDSTRKSSDYAASDRRKSSSTNPVRFSVALMGPTRASTTGPTKPSLRKATVVAAQDEGRRPTPTEPTDLVQIVVEPPSSRPNTQSRVAEAAPQRMGSSPSDTFNSMVEKLLRNEVKSEVRQESVSNPQELLNFENAERERRKTGTTRANFSSPLSFSKMMARLKERIARAKDPDIAVSLKYLISCLPTASCTQCECPMLLADIYRRLIEHCSAADLKLQQLRFMSAYGSLTMVAGYPVAAILALAKAIQIAEFNGDLSVVENKKEDLCEVVATINVLLAEARLQIGDLTEARRLVHKAPSLLARRRPKASAQAYALNSDIYMMEGEWAKAEREAFKALKSGGLLMRRSARTPFADEAWALAGAMDAARLSGHPKLCGQLERAIADLDQSGPARTSELLLLIAESASSSPEMTGSADRRPRRSLRRMSVTDPRRARAAARLLYSISVSRLDRGDIKGASEPGEAALSAAEAMGASMARAAILPHLALTKLLLLDMTRSIALISYFRKTLEREDSSDSTRRSSANLRHTAKDRYSIGSPKTPLSISIEEDSVLLSTAEYHCIRLDATLYAGVPLRDAHREAEHFIQMFLGAKSIVNSAAQRVATRLSLLNARKGRWTECALLSTLASPYLTILETDLNSSLAETGNAAMHLLEAALYGYASTDHENESPMKKMFDKIPQWIKALKHFVKGAPILVPRFLFLSAYFKTLRSKRDQAMKEIIDALSIADQQGNCLARENLVLHQAIWREEVVGSTAAQWLYSIERNGGQTSQDMRPSVSTVPLASIPSDESVETVRSKAAPPPSSPTDPHSPTPDQPQLPPDFVDECKPCVRPTSLSLHHFFIDEDSTCFMNDPGIRRWESRRRSTAPTADDKGDPTPSQSGPTDIVSSPANFTATFFCLPVPAQKRKS